MFWRGYFDVVKTIVDETEITLQFECEQEVVIVTMRRLSCSTSDSRFQIHRSREEMLKELEKTRDNASQRIVSKIISCITYV